MNAFDVAKELARIDLPLSTYTQWYWKIDLHNLLHFLTLRVDGHAQYEIRAFGNIMAGMLKAIAPLSYEAWIDYDVCGARMSRMEMEAIKRMVQGELMSNQLLQDDHKMGDREIEEFRTKFVNKPYPDFTLDLTQTVDGAVFEERFAAAVKK